MGCSTCNKNKKLPRSRVSPGKTVKPRRKLKTRDIRNPVPPRPRKKR